MATPIFEMSHKAKRKPTSRAKQNPLVNEIVDCIERHGSDAEAIFQIAYELNIDEIVVEEVMMELIREGQLTLVPSGVIDYFSGIHE
ncbi:MAG: hypothetical protein VW270_16015 [Candidatus Poseidoniales archaeon]